MLHIYQEHEKCLMDGIVAEENGKVLNYYIFLVPISILQLMEMKHVMFSHSANKSTNKSIILDYLGNES